MGRFPAYEVQPGDRFRVTTGCLAGSQGCNVNFLLRYSLEGKPLATLKSWKEKYDGNLTHIDIDLSKFQGKTVEFVLAVQANKNSNNNYAFWLLPSIWK
jgi:hypothetical protein